MTPAQERTRSRAALRATILAAAGLATACGAADQSGLPPPRTFELPESSAPPAAIQVLNGWTGDAVDGVLVTPADPTAGSRARVRAEGYLLRELRWPSQGQISLWPIDLVSAAYIQELVYAINPGRLARRGIEPLTVSLEGELRGDPSAQAHVRHAAAEISRVTGLDVTLDDGGSITIALDPDDEYFADNPNIVAYASNTLTLDTLTATRIVIADPSTVRASRFGDHVFLHEIAHGLGLDHSREQGDVMTREASGTSPIYFSPREEQCLWMMYRHRRPGNEYPDRDYRADASAVSASAGESRTIVILD